MGILLPSAGIAFEFPIDILKGWMQEKCFNLFQLTNSAKVLETTKKLLLITENDGELMTTIYNSLLGIAYGLVIIYFLIDLMEKMTNAGRAPSLEQYIFAIFKLCISITVIKHGADLIKLICNLGNAFVNLWTVDPPDNSESVAAYNLSLYEEIKEWNLIKCLMGFIIGTLIHAVYVVPNLMITLHAISRKIEVIIRGGFACVAVPDVFTEGLRSGCVRYFKKFAALLLHGGVMILIITISQNLQAQDAASAFDNNFSLTDFEALLAPILYTFAAVGTISASKSIINDAFGV